MLLARMKERPTSDSDEGLDHREEKQRWIASTTSSWTFTRKQSRLQYATGWGRSRWRRSQIRRLTRPLIASEDCVVNCVSPSRKARGPHGSTTCCDLMGWTRPG